MPSRIRLNLTVLFLFLSAFVAKAQNPQPIVLDFRGFFQIADFEIRSDYPNEKNIVIEADDEEHKYRQKINGDYSFTVNSYVKKLRFETGKASLPVDFAESSLFYIKHQNKKGKEIQKLYYASVKSNEVSFFQIPLWLLWLIPVLIIIIVSIIRKLIILAALILFFLFFWINGLDLATLFDLLANSISALFSLF